MFIVYHNKFITRRMGRPAVFVRSTREALTFARPGRIAQTQQLHRRCIVVSLVF
jgi:hypothetical protein